MEERTAKSLADAFESVLKEKPKRNLQCESEDEAVLLAHELNKRGYKCTVDKALGGSLNSLSVVDVVRVSGRHKAKSR